MDDGNKKRLRSPNCPGISLEDALQKAKRVYIEEHTQSASREVIAKDLGYSGISGTSATVIGALRQYGILEGRGEGMRISDDAVAAYELEAASAERIEALRRMAFKPELFEELRSQFPERVPGEANLRHILIKKGFVSKQADEVIHAYKENFELVNPQESPYNESMNQAVSDKFEMRDSVQVRLQAASAGTSSLKASASIVKEILNQRVSPACTAQVVFDGPVTRRAVEKLIAYLALAKDDYPENGVEG